VHRFVLLPLLKVQRWAANWLSGTSYPFVCCACTPPGGAAFNRVFGLPVRL